MKTCKKCGVEKPETDYLVSRNKSGNRLGDCYACRVEYKRQWRANNPDKVKAEYDRMIARKGKTRRVLKTPEEIRIRENEYNKKWQKQDRLKHPEKYKVTQRKLEWQRRHRELYPEKNKAYARKYYYQDPHKSIAKSVEFMRKKRQADPEGCRQRDREKYDAKYKYKQKARRDNLEDNYIKKLMTGKSLADYVPQALIEAKRLQILINRRIKNEKCNTTKK